MRTSASLDQRPTADGERLEILDSMRGFALGGIFLLNLAVFSGFMFMSPEAAAAAPTAALDMPVAGLTIWLGLPLFAGGCSLLLQAASCELPTK